LPCLQLEEPSARILFSRPCLRGQNMPSSVRRHNGEATANELPCVYFWAAATSVTPAKIAHTRPSIGWHWRQFHLKHSPTYIVIGRAPRNVPGGPCSDSMAEKETSREVLNSFFQAGSYLSDSIPSFCWPSSSVAVGTFQVLAFRTVFPSLSLTISPLHSRHSFTLPSLPRLHGASTSQL
jgi:hypothetical protein